MMRIWSDHYYSSASALRCAVSACAYLPTHTNTWDNSSPTCGCAVCRPNGRIGDRTDGVSRLPRSCNRVTFESGWIQNYRRTVYESQLIGRVVGKPEKWLERFRISHV